MKKLLLSLMLMFGLCVHVEAAVRIQEVQLEISGVDIESTELTSPTTQYSDAIDVTRNEGFVILYVNASGGAADLDVYAEYSYDGTNFHRPYVSNMSGTLTVEGDIVTTLGVAERYIVFTPRPAQMMRIAFKPDGTTTVTSKLFFVKSY